MKSFFKEITFQTKGAIEFIDVTDKIKEVYITSGITNGLLNVYSNHTTAAIKINERCERLQSDMEAFLKAMVPQECCYSHNALATDSRQNAHSHIMSLLLNASETIPIRDGKLALGTWQSVFFVELDGPRVNRKLSIKIIGE